MKKDRIKIIYEDKNIIVVDKPAKLLTIATDKVRDNTMYHKVFEYLKQKNKKNKLFIIHRLDKETSGILIFAKNERVKELFQQNWNDIAKVRNYIAVVEGVPTKDENTIQNYLIESKSFVTHSTNDKKNGKLAITSYKVFKKNKRYSMLNIEIKTGRKNQIRVHMSEMGNPIVGDKKYNSKENPIHRMCLHANMLKILNPINDEIMTFESKIPESFNLLFPKGE